MAAALERRHDEAHSSSDEMRKAKDTLAAVIDASPVAIVCSDPSRQILLWSRGAEQDLRLHAAEDTLGQRTMIVPPGPGGGIAGAVRPRLRAARRCATCRLTRTAQGRLAHRRPDGAAPMYNPDGTVRAVAWVYEDITDRQQGRGATAAAGALRPAHRPGEPAVLAEGAEPPARRATASRSPPRSCCSTSTASRTSTTRSAIPPATSCWSRSAGA